jgi:hypothetical protein
MALKIYFSAIIMLILKLKQKTFTDNENNYNSEQNIHSRSGQSLSDNKRKKLMDVMQNLVELQNKISSK